MPAGALTLDEKMEEAFLRSLDGSDDATRRRIFADWLEEHGDEGGACGQRWLADNGMSPHYGGSKDYCWGCRERMRSHSPVSQYLRHCLPGAVFDLLPDDLLRDRLAHRNDTWWGYVKQRLTCERAALAAWRLAWEKGYRP